MSLIRKIGFLLIVFIGFIIYSVYSFNYDSKVDSQALVLTPAMIEVVFSLNASTVSLKRSVVLALINS